MSKCEVCVEERIGVIKRPNGELLCSDHNRDRMREMTPTGLTRNDELIAMGLYRFYRSCGLLPDHALERLAFNLAMEPPMFTRLVPLLDELRQGGRNV